MERTRAKMAQNGGEKLFHDPEFTELYGDTGVAKVGLTPTRTRTRTRARARTRTRTRTRTRAKVGGVLALVLEALRAPQRKLLLFAHHAAVMSRLEHGLLAG